MVAAGLVVLAADAARAVLLLLLLLDSVAVPAAAGCDDVDVVEGDCICRRPTGTGVLRILILEEFVAPELPMLEEEVAAASAAASWSCVMTGGDGIVVVEAPE